MGYMRVGVDACVLEKGRETGGSCFDRAFTVVCDGAVN